MNDDIQHLTVEQLLYDADELLRCAKATAYEPADGQQGNQRDHAFSVVHLIQAARDKMDKALNLAEPADLEHRL